MFEKQEKLDLSNILFVVGGVFTGKSILTSQISSHLGYYNIISTDLIRNILRTNNDKKINISTSDMDLDVFNYQRNIISNMITKILPNYYLRGEKTIFEGIHFSYELLDFVYQNGGNCIFLKSMLSRKNRVELKLKSTPIIKVIEEGNEKLIKYNDIIDIKNLKYYKQENNYFKIEEQIYNNCLTLGIKIIEFHELPYAYSQILTYLQQKAIVD